MKALRYQKQRGGFTLMEIIIAIAILAMLSALVWQSSKLVNTRKMCKTAEIQIGQLEAALNDYRQDNSDTVPYGDGDPWSSHMLYQALYCDENNDGEPDKDKNSDEPREPYCAAIVPIEDLKKTTEIQNGIPAIKINTKAKRGKKGGKFYVLIDPWGKPYLYRTGFELRDEHDHRGKGINADFDIFSQGPDGLGDGRNNTGDNEDNISNIRTWD